MEGVFSGQAVPVMGQLSDVTIDGLGLPEAAYNGLKRAGINDLEQLACLVLSGWPSARKNRWIGASGKRDVTNAFMDFAAKRLRTPYTVTARLVSVWNDGIVHRSLCRADLKERRITDAEAVPASYPWPADREYVEIGSFRYSVSRKLSSLTLMRDLVYGFCSSGQRFARG